ncbi:hypothetical protein [Spirosoma sp.]|uniref:hypothetical protein n=1 Tax=Spirosoma sp. TaxID=1899569 RepID=UPI002626CFDF|nr:hypothetical protein [Spirosoma sp.]MCX6216478.1 hypothetical protein [Spirosoma sp.]
MAKPPKSPDAAPQPEAAPAFDIVGLELAASMPIYFENRLFDLAHLSADEATYLLGFPEQVPYLRVTI